MKIKRSFMSALMTRGVYIRFKAKYKDMVNITAKSFDGNDLPDY